MGGIRLVHHPAAVWPFPIPATLRRPRCGGSTPSRLSCNPSHYILLSTGSIPPSPVLRLPLPAARFSPDDKFSRHRVTVKKRYGLLLTQQPAMVY